MKLTRSLLAFALNFALVLPVIFVLQTQNLTAQNANGALQRGYRTGYSDGYMAGYRDSIDSLARSIVRHAEFQAADRAYNKDYGPLDDYRDGYQQGFGIGYDTGFEKKTFESSVPPNLEKKGLNTVPIQSKAEQSKIEPEQVQTTSGRQEPVIEKVTESQSNKENVLPTSNLDPSLPVREPQNIIQKASFTTNDGIVLIPKETEMVLELQGDLSTENARQGERFTAKVVSPMELDGAIVEGHVEKIQIPDRLRRTAELQLTFDRIILNDKRWSNFSGILTEIAAIKGDNIRRVTDEGTAIGQSSIKGDAIKVGGATGAGAGVGALVGGPVGAAVGAGIGAAFGIGSAVIERGKHIRLNKNQQLHIRSSYETQIK